MIGGDHHGTRGRNAGQILGHHAVSHIQQRQQALERGMATMALCFAAGRLQHAAQPVHQQEFLNGRLDRSQEALERIVEQPAQVDGDKARGVSHAYRIAPPVTWV
jgi:hypothetical protein